MFVKNALFLHRSLIVKSQQHSRIELVTRPAQQSSDEAEEEAQEDDNVLNKNNPTFKDEFVSSKITTLVKVRREILDFNK